MELSPSDESQKYSLTKFESMLKTNNVFFFDSNEFESIIHHYLEIGKVALAKKAINLGLDQHPSSINLRLFRVEILIFENDFNAAEKLLNTLFELEPNNEELYIQRANIYSKKDQHQKAIDTFKEAIKIADDCSEIHSLIGMEYLFLNEYEQAKTHFMKCVDLDIEDYSSLYNIIYCFEFLNQTKQAIKYLNWYLDQNPYCEVAWHQLGKQYLEEKELQKLAKAHKEAQAEAKRVEKERKLDMLKSGDYDDTNKGLTSKKTAEKLKQKLKEKQAKKELLEETENKINSINNGKFSFCWKLSRR